MLHILAHMTFCVAAIALAVAAIDTVMEYVMEEDRWRILFGQNEIYIHLALLFFGGGVAYAFGWFIGGIPLAVALTAIAAVIIHGFYTLRIHKKRKSHRLHLHKWVYDAPPYINELVAIRESQATRTCSICGKEQVLDEMCLGLNPPKYVKNWRTVKNG